MKIFFKILIVILVVGMLFKIQHWPYANLILVIAFSTLALSYPFRFIKKQEKKFLDYTKLILVVFWSISGIFIILHLPYKIIFQLITSAAFLIWFFMEGMQYFSGSETGKNQKQAISRFVWGLSALITIAGIAFKIMLAVCCYTFNNWSRNWRYMAFNFLKGITHIY